MSDGRIINEDVPTCGKEKCAAMYNVFRNEKLNQIEANELFAKEPQKLKVYIERICVRQQTIQTELDALVLGTKSGRRVGNRVEFPITLQVPQPEIKPQDLSMCKIQQEGQTCGANLPSCPANQPRLGGCGNDPPPSSREMILPEGCAVTIPPENDVIIAIGENVTIQVNSSDFLATTNNEGGQCCDLDAENRATKSIHETADFNDSSNVEVIDDQVAITDIAAAAINHPRSTNGSDPDSKGIDSETGIIRSTNDESGTVNDVPNTVKSTNDVPDTAKSITDDATTIKSSYDDSGTVKSTNDDSGTVKSTDNTDTVKSTSVSTVKFTTEYDIKSNDDDISTQNVNDDSGTEKLDQINRSVRKDYDGNSASAKGQYREICCADLINVQKRIKYLQKQCKFLDYELKSMEDLYDELGYRSCDKSQQVTDQVRAQYRKEMDERLDQRLAVADSLQKYYSVK